MTTPELPARVSLGFRRDKRLSFTGIGDTRTVPQDESTAAIKDLLEDIYADATPCGDSVTIAKPKLGNHFRIRWTTQGGPMLRFYLGAIKKIRPKYEVPGDPRTIALRAMVEMTFSRARTDEQHAADEAARPVPKTAEEIEEAEWKAKLLAGELKEPGV